MRIGFIGLGIMGRPMAKNLVKAGHSLVVCDHHPANAAELAALGAQVADSAAEVAAGVEPVLTMLPNSPQVRQVALGHDFKPGFRVDLHHKDLTNALATAHAVASPMPLTAAVFEQLSQLRALGWGGEDHAALLRVVEAAAGARLDAGEEPK
ncbi:MAG: NAD-binding protein [Bifidobacteriaceae bacterium]|jgi:3-hydroxyisobutyrate dehydrogenase-like beta-hydroxyacid dehydrogenase|nr:NAD-binding protein [Bifidobacteriaceae bacterium]